MVVTEFMRFEQPGRIRPGAGIGEEMLQTRGLTVAFAPVFDAVAEKSGIAVLIGGDALCDVRHHDAHHAAGFEDAVDVLQQGHGIGRVEQVLQQVREEHITALAVHERQAPQHIGRQLRRKHIEVDPAIEHVRTAADVQLQAAAVLVHAQALQLLHQIRPAQTLQIGAQLFDQLLNLQQARVDRRRAARPCGLFGKRPEAGQIAGQLEHRLHHRLAELPVAFGQCRVVVHAQNRK